MALHIHKPYRSGGWRELLLTRHSGLSVRSVIKGRRNTFLISPSITQRASNTSLSPLSCRHFVLTRSEAASPDRNPRWNSEAEDLRLIYGRSRLKGGEKRSFVSAFATPGKSQSLSATWRETHFAGSKNTQWNKTCSVTQFCGVGTSVSVCCVYARLRDCHRLLEML